MSGTVHIRDESLQEELRDMWTCGITLASAYCYELKPLELDNRTTLILNNTRELNRELLYKLVYLI